MITGLTIPQFNDSTLNPPPLLPFRTIYRYLSNRAMLKKLFPFTLLKFYPLTLITLIILAGCQTTPPPGTMLSRRGDEIVVAGNFVHTGTPVVLWMDPGGYDAYRVERRFSPLEQSDWQHSMDEVKDLHTPNRYNIRRNGLTDEDLQRVRGGGWDLPTLQKVVDQFVIHFDVCGTSRQCFNVLHDHRGL